MLKILKMLHEHFSILLSSSFGKSNSNCHSTYISTSFPSTMFCKFYNVNRQYFYTVLINRLTDLIAFQIRAVKLISHLQEKLIKWEIRNCIAVSVHSTLPHIHGQLTEGST